MKFLIVFIGKKKVTVKYKPQLKLMDRVCISKKKISLQE